MTASRLSRLRLWLRRALAEDRGDTIIEVIGAMVVITIVTAAFALSFASMSTAQSRAHNNDIGTQASRGVVEQARSVPWTDLAFSSADAGYAPTCDGRATVTSNSLSPTASRVKPVVTQTVRNVPLTLTTCITYTDAAQTTKRISVTAQWKTKGKSSSYTYSTLLAATPDDVAPSRVPTGS